MNKISLNFLLRLYDFIEKKMARLFRFNFTKAKSFRRNPLFIREKLVMNKYKDTDL